MSTLERLTDPMAITTHDLWISDRGRRFRVVGNVLTYVAWRRVELEPEDGASLGFATSVHLDGSGMGTRGFYRETPETEHAYDPERPSEPIGETGRDLPTDCRTCGMPPTFHIFGCPEIP